jgi:hypothetical protein
MTLGGAQSLLANTLSRVMHLSHVPSKLVVSHKSHILNTYDTEDVILKILRQPPTLLIVFSMDSKRTHVRRSSFLPTRGGCQCSSPFCIEAQSDGPLSPVASFRL